MQTTRKAFNHKYQEFCTCKQEKNKNVDRGLKQLFQQSMKSKVRKLKRYIKENTNNLDSLEQANYVYEQLPDMKPRRIRCTTICISRKNIRTSTTKD